MRWLVFLVLVSGCVTQPELRERFVCYDGWVAGDAPGCTGHNPNCPVYNCTKCPECKEKAEYVYVNSTQQPAAASQDDSCVRLGCPPGSKYVSSKTSGKYHTCGCRFAEVLSAKSRICYGSREEAEAAGKAPCGICATSAQR
jgi:hypothetical protein